jgi:hypothetical protein
LHVSLVFIVISQKHVGQGTEFQLHEFRLSRRCRTRTGRPYRTIWRLLQTRLYADITWRSTIRSTMRHKWRRRTAQARCNTLGWVQNRWIGRRRARGRTLV